MSSKGDNRKVGNGGTSGNGKLLNDLQTISKAYYVDKTRPRLTSSTASSRSKTVVKPQLPAPKMKAEDAKNKTKDSSDKDKKSSIWSWKGFKALTNVRSQRFNCCFSLLVHNIEGLPVSFESICLLVHWKRRDGDLTTSPIRVRQGMAEFEEQLTHTCSVYGSRNGPHHSAKYEAKHFLLYVSVYGSPEIDLGRHRIDLTRLLPLTLEELQEEKSSGKWTTSFRLSGKAKGAAINVSFGYVVENDITDISTSKNAPEMLRFQRSSSRTENILGIYDQMDNVVPYMGGSLPEMSSSSNQSSEDFKDLHEILPSSRSELCDSVNILYQKLNEEISSTAAKNSSEDDTLTSHVDSCKVNLSTPADAGEYISRMECEMTDFSVIDKGVEELTKGESANESLDVAKEAGGDLESEGVVESGPDQDALVHPSAVEFDTVTDDQSILAKITVGDLGSEIAVDAPIEEALVHPSDVNVVPQNDDQSKNVAKKAGDDLESEAVMESAYNEDALVLPSALDFVPQNDGQSNHAFNFNKDFDTQNDDQSKQTSNYEDIEYDMDSKELLLRELEEALNCTSDLVDEGFDSREDEADALHLKNSFETNSDLVDLNKGKSPCLDDVSDSVASDFLMMLGMEHSPVGLSSESEPESPRERLLRQFEKDMLSDGGGLLNFDMDDDLAEVVDDIPMTSAWGAISEDFISPAMFDGFHDTSEVEIDAFKTKARGLRMEDLETEALMREWGLNEGAFQHSPPSGSGGFGFPNDIPPEDPQQLPPLAEGLGPFVQTQDGGFIRTMNPTLFKNAKSGGSLIMQASSPVVVPAEMGSSVMDVLQGLASVGIEKLSMQANKLMPLEDITGKTIQQIALQGAPSLEGPERPDFFHQDSEIKQSVLKKSVKGVYPASGPNKPRSNTHSSDTEYVSLEDLAPLAMDKIEALSIEGLRIQSGMSDEEAPSNITAQSIGEFSALKGNTDNATGSIGLDGTGGLQLLDIKDNGEDVDGLMGLSLTLDEWVKLDSGEIDDDDLVSERTSKILAAHHATSLDQFRGRSKGEKRRGRSRKYGLLGNNFTVALLVQLRDPLRNYEPVGTPMLALIQVERVFVPPKPRLYSTVSLISESNDDEAPKSTQTENTVEKPKDDQILAEELIPQFKVTEVHVAGLKTEQDNEHGKKKLWGSTNQQQAGSRWLLANGMGKKNKHPLMKSKVGSGTATGKPRDSLWSVSSRELGKGAKPKGLGAQNSHNRNPNVILPK